MEFKVITAMDIYVAIFWDIAPAIFDHEDGDGNVPPKRRFTYRLHGAISQKMAT
jgi:hypothetical protein